MFINNTQLSNSLNKFAKDKSLKLQNKEIQCKELVADRNQLRTTNKEQKRYIEEFVVSKEGVKRIQKEAEIEKEKYIQA